MMKVTTKDNFNAMRKATTKESKKAHIQKDITSKNAGEGSFQLLRKESTGFLMQRRMFYSYRGPPLLSVLFWLIHTVEVQL